MDFTAISPALASKEFAAVQASVEEQTMPAVLVNALICEPLVAPFRRKGR